jgi:hypothetical protein
MFRLKQLLEVHFNHRRALRMHGEHREAYVSAKITKRKSINFNHRELGECTKSAAAKDKLTDYKDLVIWKRRELLRFAGVN